MAATLPRQQLVTTALHVNHIKSATRQAAAAGAHEGWRRTEVAGGVSRGCHTKACFATQASQAWTERRVSLDVSLVSANTKTVTVTFADNTSSTYPFVWLRENCQCSSCFQNDAIARLFLLDDLDVHIQPKELQVKDGCLRVTWSDGHVSVFTGKWLSRRAFTPEARTAQRTWFMLPKVLWGTDFEVPYSKYSTVMHDDRALLEWLVVLEKYGVTVVEEAPTRVGAINDFIERLGFLKPTHYGKHFFCFLFSSPRRDYEIVTQVTPNNLAYTGARLGLHTDLPYCEYPPGTTWLHCIRQHQGKGGENDLTDGFHAAEILRERHRHHFETLVNTPIYFQDQGYALYAFDKITQKMAISLDHLGKVCRIHMSSQSRDSILDLDDSGVIKFYEALKAYNDVLREFSVCVKTKPGDILIIDNTRVLHGRTPFDPKTSEGPRIIHNAYIDLDDLRSKRRILQERLANDLSQGELGFD
ncbi:Gamma-butyrobetaine dioxygenase [Chionoecetes opilio]|uniref:Gamma-butyrobetaine dioxygenase n=1 Tax=Chionoecetes opilio TaxID=41210 RepID=A0A8J4XT60_CHIOP|nr:Gamma-butyrobetaine dioxygenase [Chionoecetes opilio]